MFLNRRKSKGAAIAVLILGLAALALFAPRGFLPWRGDASSPVGERDAGGEASPRVAVVTVDGVVWGTLPLSREGGREVFTVETPRGWNRLVLQGGTVAVEDANCPTHICQKQGPISHPGEIIACLPHKLLIEVREAP